MSEARPAVVWRDAFPEAHQTLRRNSIKNWAIAIGAIGAVVGVVLAIGLPGSIDVDTLLPPAALARIAPSRPVRTKPKPRQHGIKPGRLEDAVQLEKALLTGDRVIISGTVAPNAVVRITLDGQPLPVTADGTRFHALLGRRKTSFELIAEGIDGQTRSERVLVGIGDGVGRAGRDTVKLNRRLDGQTFHEASLTPDTAEEAAPILLDRVETFIQLPDGVIRVYRAPEGLTYLRTTRTGQYAFLRECDGQEVILVPAGIARRGFGKEAPNGPRHIVRLSAYLIDRIEVTRAQYSRFLVYMERVADGSLRHRDDYTRSLRPLGWAGVQAPTGTADLPVTGVSWYGAYAYSRWVGGRLPTEAEWERAAAGARGFHFPWGDDFEESRCNARSSALMPARSLLVGESVFGLLHACGNAREWCSDRYGPRWYSYDRRIDPRGPGINKHRVVRGGSHTSSLNDLVLQVRNHAAPGAKLEDIGFRVAQTWPAEIR